MLAPSAARFECVPLEQLVRAESHQLYRLDSATFVGRSFLQHEKPPQLSTANLPEER